MVNIVASGINPTEREGRTVLRLAHLFISSLPPPHALSNMQAQILAKQVMHKQFNRRIVALRTLSVAAADADVRTELLKAIVEIFGTVAPDKAESAQGSRKKERDVERACLQYGACSALRQREGLLLLSDDARRDNKVRAPTHERRTAARLLEARPPDLPPATRARTAGAARRDARDGVCRPRGCAPRACASS